MDEWGLYMDKPEMYAKQEMLEPKNHILYMKYPELANLQTNRLVAS
jgi:hypothetical protein